MTDNAMLAEELSRIMMDRAQRAIADDEVGVQESENELANLVDENMEALLAALRAPAPAEDVVERVARAIATARQPDRDPVLHTIAGFPFWHYFEGDARAALAAMPAPQPGEVERRIVRWLRDKADLHRRSAHEYRDAGDQRELASTHISISHACSSIASDIERGKHRAQEPGLNLSELIEQVALNTAAQEPAAGERGDG